MHPSVRQVVLGRSKFSGYELALDFKNGIYRSGNIITRDPSLLPGYSFAQAGSNYEIDANGQLVPFAANQPRILPGIGYRAYGALTNKCTNYNANPTDLTGVAKSGDAAATLTVVDDSAALAAAGLAGICTSGKVYKLDNSAGSITSTASFSGQTANTNAHSATIFVRGGTGVVFNNFGDSPGASAFGASATYVRRSYSMTPGGTNRQMTIRADIGQVVYFILNQLTETTIAASSLPIIPTTGSAATVAAADMREALALPTVPFLIHGSVVVSAANNNRRVFQWDDGTGSNRILVQLDINNRFSFVHTLSGASQTAITESGTFGDRNTNWALRWDGAGYSLLAAGIKIGTLSGSLPSGLVRILFGNSETIGASPLNGVIGKHLLRLGTFSDAEVTAILGAA